MRQHRPQASDRRAPPLSPGARALVRLLEQDSRKAKSPAGAFVLLAARLNSPASEVAEMTGLSLREVNALVLERGRLVGMATMRRLGAWVALLWARRATDAQRAALLAAAWESPVPVAARRTP